MTATSLDPRRYAVAGLVAVALPLASAALNSDLGTFFIVGGGSDSATDIIRTPPVFVGATVLATWCLLFLVAERPTPLRRALLLIFLSAWCLGGRSMSISLIEGDLRTQIWTLQTHRISPRDHGVSGEDSVARWSVCTAAWSVRVTGSDVHDTLWLGPLLIGEARRRLQVLGYRCAER